MEVSIDPSAPRSNKVAVTRGNSKEQLTGEVGAVVGADAATGWTFVGTGSVVTMVAETMMGSAYAGVGEATAAADAKRGCCMTMDIGAEVCMPGCSMLKLMWMKPSCKPQEHEEKEATFTTNVRQNKWPTSTSAQSALPR